MIKISAKNKAGGVAAELEMPGGLDELPLNRYIDFFAHTKRAMYRNPVQEMAAALAAFCGVDVQEIYGIAADGEGGLRQLYAFALDRMHNWGPAATGANGGMVFEHEGQVFEVRDFLAPQTDMTTAEAIEALEVVRLFGDEIDKRATLTEAAIDALASPGDKEKAAALAAAAPKGADISGERAIIDLIAAHGDEDGNFAFTRFVKIVAIFARKPGETLPPSEAERAAFIEKRMLAFQGISAKTALEVDFFLQTMFARSGMTPPCIGSLTRPLLEAVAETKLRRGRHIKAASGRKNRSSKKPGGARW